MPLSLREIMSVSAVLADYVECLAIPFDAETRRSVRFREIGLQLAGTEADRVREDQRLQ